MRATEGYTSQLDGHRRDLLPIYSLMVATESLPDSVWSEIGLADRPTFADGRHMIIYGQRTADGRLAFGGRGAPYHFGSVIKPQFDTDETIRNPARDVASRICFRRSDRLPSPITGAASWVRLATGPVRFDSIGRPVWRAQADTSVTVSAPPISAAEHLAALITQGDDPGDLTRLPWVGHRSRKWEPEPLRWIGVNAARAAARRADSVELRTGRDSKLWGGMIDRLLHR